MEARKSCFLVLFAVCVARSLAGVSDCDEVRKVFQERQIGTVKSVPERPRKVEDVMAFKTVTYLPVRVLNF
ncbi:hypothetical protein Z043_102741 [Scleropages formosus]|uniref:Glypican-6-like n=1 Tax=Scleropages formosus TaxID=113540 RepID=A0A0P7ZA99_SCLFO|nr:hypothetical protein Z043_102741 [Scleropages formosus]